MSDGARKWAVLAVVCVMVFMANYTQFQVSALAVVVMPELGIGSVEFSSILFAPLLAAMILGVPLGMAADRFGSKRIVSLCAAVSVLCSVSRMVCEGFPTFFLASVGMGVGPAALNSNLVKVLGSWFGDRTDFAAGWYYASGSAGMACSLATSALFPSVDSAYLAASIVLSVACAAWAVLAKDGPESREAVGGSGMLGSLSVAARCAPVWLIAVLLGFGLASTEAFSGFLTTALEGSVGLSNAGAFASLVTFGSIFGSVFSPWLRAWFSDYKVFLVVVTAIGSALLAVSSALLDNPVPPLLFLTGVFTAAGGPILQGLPYQLPSIGAQHAGSAGGIISSVSLTMTYFVPLALAMAAGDDFPMMIALCVGCFALGVPLMLFLPSSKKLSEE